MSDQYVVNDKAVGEHVQVVAVTDVEHPVYMNGHPVTTTVEQTSMGRMHQAVCEWEGDETVDGCGFVGVPTTDEWDAWDEAQDHNRETGDPATMPARHRRITVGPWVDGRPTA